MKNLYKFNDIADLKEHLKETNYTWLITGVAGFIGSNLLESLLLLNQSIVGIDNFSNGDKKNIDEVKKVVSDNQWEKFNFIEGDISDFQLCNNLCKDVDFVLHQAALGSVPRSIKNPTRTNESNITGFLNMLTAAKDHKIKKFIYAASSSTYGDHKALPKIEENIGKPLSPYAVTKLVNEIYSNVFYKNYNYESIGLRYFNVFGKRQNPNGAYAAVIPKWINSMILDEKIYINGDGKTSRDFCYIDNVIQANILSAFSSNFESSKVFNIALGDRTTLLELFELIKSALKFNNIIYDKDPIFKDFRKGDVLHSQASIKAAMDYIDYKPTLKIKDGLNNTVKWYIENSDK